MKNLIYIVGLAGILASCTKVIDIDLNNANPQIAIEANLQEGTHDFTTNISLTGNYFGGNPAQVSGATVELFDGTNNYTLTETTNGNYRLSAFTALPGITYTLTVTANGKTYTASSTMPNPVVLDTLTYQYQPASAFNEEGYFLFLNFQDPQEANFYRGIITVNAEPTKDITDLYIFDDEFTNGNYIIIPVFGEIYELNDNVAVDLYSLSEASYNYYETLSQITGNSGGGNVAPANPNSNWSNNALGNFNTYSISSFSGTVQ